ncbi:MAG: hypothetical protein NZ737_00620, partial [Candidatus Poseidoniaceae archaeon]|nr:hypothetical protein [Candidatus Poseidoniaceae archaeon]
LDLYHKVGALGSVLIPLLVFTTAFFGAKFAIQYLPKKAVTVIFLVAVSLGLFRYFIDFATMI